MPDLTLLLIFIPTFFLVSITPGLCMTLAMTLGMAVGYKKTLNMMGGELLGVALVAVSAMYSVVSIAVANPMIFSVFKYIGGLYLVYVGYKTWTSDVPTTQHSIERYYSPYKLFYQGFLTAVLNPKGWAFMITLLPPFIDFNDNVGMQLGVLLVVLLSSEFLCMSLYALGGKELNKVLVKKQKVHLLNKITGTLLCSVGIWLAIS